VTGFELFFSLFGLILGLAVAVVISGLSDILRERSPVKIGWLTPMLALFLLVDLSTLWVNSWTGLNSIEVAYGPFFAAMIVAGLYFFAASMVFPKTATDWPSLDDYYMHRYRYVLGGVLLANLGVTVMDAVANRSWAPFVRFMAGSEVSAIWWITVIAMLIASRRWVQLAGLSVLLLCALYAMIMFWTPH
jgi:hypothetical protein